MNKPAPPPVPRISEHRARSEYRCDDPDQRDCRRHIARGETYVQLSWPPLTGPFRSPTWIIVRACSACRTPSTSTTTSCPIGAAGMTCLGDAGHEGDHIYATALF